MNKPGVGVIGASSMVGGYVLDRLKRSESAVIAFSRSVGPGVEFGEVNWQVLSPASMDAVELQELSDWICLCPIWSVPQHFSLMRTFGIRRIVALSPTSIFTKTSAGSGDLYENGLAEQLAEGERKIQSWAEINGIEWVILRPTLIYDFIQDNNISHIAAFIRQYGFFPILHGARGRRQPVHAAEVAYAVCAALGSHLATNRSYNISGGETLSYRVMVERIFGLIEIKPKFVNVPIWGFKIAIILAKFLPKYRHLSSAMAERMATDLVFDHTAAMVDLGYVPGKFPVHAPKAK